MIDDINAEPDYGDEPPCACFSRVFLGHDSFACGGTPGHVGKHGYRLPWVTIEWDGRAERAASAAPQPAPEVGGELNRLRTQIKIIRELAEGASVGNLAATPRGKFAAAILTQLDPS